MDKIIKTKGGTGFFVIEEGGVLHSLTFYKVEGERYHFEASGGKGQDIDNMIKTITEDIDNFKPCTPGEIYEAINLITEHENKILMYLKNKFK